VLNPPEKKHGLSGCYLAITNSQLHHKPLFLMRCCLCACVLYCCEALDMGLLQFLSTCLNLSVTWATGILVLATKVGRLASLAVDIAGPSIFDSQLDLVQEPTTPVGTVGAFLPARLKMSSEH